MDAWLAALRGRLPRHAELLDALLELSRAYDRIRVLATAARACAALLREASARARARFGGEPESPMAAWVSERLG